MSDSLMVIISIFVAVILMFIFPLMSISDRNDDISQTMVQTQVSEFVDKISVAGKIRPSDYEAFAAAINAANGAPYDIEIEVQHLDDNLQAKVATVSKNLLGENARYSTFTSEIEDEMYPTTGPHAGEKVDYVLKKGDNVIVTVKNTSQTLAQLLRSAFYKITGQDTVQVAGSASSMVINTGKRDT